MTYDDYKTTQPDEDPWLKPEQEDDGRDEARRNMQRHLIEAARHIRKAQPGCNRRGVLEDLGSDVLYEVNQVEAV